MVGTTASLTSNFVIAQWVSENIRKRGERQECKLKVWISCLTIGRSILSGTDDHHIARALWRTLLANHHPHLDATWSVSWPAPAMLSTLLTKRQKYSGLILFRRVVWCMQVGFAQTQILHRHKRVWVTVPDAREMSTTLLPVNDCQSGKQSRYWGRMFHSQQNFQQQIIWSKSEAWGCCNGR